MNVRIDHGQTTGAFSLDGGTWEVDNNVWVLGDDEECVVIDAPHDSSEILKVIAGRKVRGILLTHAHNDHVDAAPDVARHCQALTFLHPDDGELWRLTHPYTPPDRPLADGQVLEVGGVDITVVHTPGHSPGSVSFYVPELGTIFTGDTLFQGGPGATGRSFSDFPTIITSIRERLLTLPPETVVRTGHGDTTTIGAEAPQLQEWIDRGH